MADVQYANPFGLFQDQNPIPSNPFMSGFQSQTNQRTAMPFINQARESSQLELMKKQMMTGEEMSPEAQGARMSAYPLQQAQNESKGRMIKPEEEAQRMRLAEEIRAMPGMTDEKIAKAHLATQNAKAAPHRELLSELGQLYDVVKDAPEQARPFLYLSALNRWKQTHPGSDVPEQFRNYNEAMLPDLGAIRHSQLYTPEQVGKERITGMQTRSAEGIAGGHDQTSIQVEGMRGASARAVASIHANSQETPPKAEARLRKELRDNPNNEDAQRELTGYLEERFDKSFQRDNLGNMLQIQATSKPEAMQKYLVYREQQKARLFMNEGVYGDIPPEGRDWVIRAIEANPNMGVANVIEQGKRMNKFKRKAK